VDLSPILARTRAVAVRIALARALRAGTTTAALAVGALAIALVAQRLGWLAPTDFLAMLVAAIAGTTLITLTSAARRLPSLTAAELLDRTHDLSGRLASAIELATSGAPMAALAIDDAVLHVRDVSPSRAFPIRPPRNGRALALAALSLALATTVERPPPPTPTATVPHLAPLLVHTDDLALERDALADLSTPDATPELRRALDETNALLESIEDRTLDRTEVLRRLGDLTARLDRPRPASLVAREELLTAIGDRLGSGETTRALASALRDADAVAAQRALQALAERAREHQLSAEERRALREALAEARAADDSDDADHELAEAERTVEEQRAAAHGEEQERLLAQQEEEVQRLREEHERRMQAEQELERLERELGESADQLDDDGSEDEEAAQSLDDAAEDLNRTAHEQASEEEMRELAEQLRQLREMIRRQREQQQGGQGDDGEGGEGSGRGSRGGASAMDRFVLRARGGDEGSEGTRIGVGGGSEGSGQTDGSQGDGGEDESGSPGGTSGSAQGEDGEGGTGDQGETQPMLVLGDQSGGSAILELPGFGRRGTGDARGGGDGEGDERGGAGHDHDPASLSDPSDRSGDHRTVAVHGEDRGRGPSRSEVIRGGAASGFASRDYERVYADYERHAEEAIEDDRIPPGYRFYVRRYFDLIRPRD
jgi:hypothetical protein